MGRRIYPRLALVVAVLLLALAALPVFAQEQTGDLFGTVTDEQKQPLPGVTVTLTGATAPQVQVSDAQGKFRFLNRPPGAYALKAELDGFSTAEYPDLAIKLGGKTTIEVTLNGAVRDVITVTGESPLLDERRVDQGTNVTTVELDKVPTARDPWSLLSQAPGVLVDRVNVGGSESGQQSNFIGVGSGSRDNTFAVDGVILTDMNAVGGSATYFDFGAFDEVQFTVSSADVTVQTSGVTDQPGDQARHQRVAGHRPLSGHRRQPAVRAEAGGRQQDRFGEGVWRRHRRTADQGPPLDLGRLRRQRHPATSSRGASRTRPS